MALSIGLHLLLIVALTADFSGKTKKSANPDVVSVPMFVVDLNKVKIGERTNLPPKLIKSGKKKSAGTGEKTSKLVSAYSAGGAKVSSGGGSSVFNPTGAHLSQGVKKLPTNLMKNDGKISDLLNSIGKKDEGEAPKKLPEFKSLLASLDGKQDKFAGYAVDSDIDEDDPDIVNTGIEGGQGGSYMQELSVSEKDLIGLRLRECWNLDPGAKGIQDMVIEIRVYLNEKGIVSEAKILNRARMKKDSAFRSVAESARRAVFVCDKKEENSPFRIFPKNYPNTYESWKTLLLRFNPMDGGVG
ncbi:MAG: hypothetical protein MJ250_07825 [Alphaproteobacteria bacterium]|nr:hypothetical protein [Alphaproteobacteria bacterium]